MTTPPKTESQGPTFYGLGIAPSILTVLDKLGFVTPTPIQVKSIPAALEGKDVMGLAQTGTGKTLAFGIPMIQAVLAEKQGLIILPTRELALQVEETIQKVGGSLGVRTALLIGGASMDRQLQQLRRGPSVVIGTPGRIIDHLEQKTISLRSVGVLVLDEADRMLDMGFAPQLKRILQQVPPADERQTMLFSATMPNDIVDIANSYMKLPLRIEVTPQGTTAAKATQELFIVSRNDKPRLLEKILEEYRGSVLVFTRTKFGAKRIAALARHIGHTANEIHSNRSLAQRREALEGFKNGRYRVLAATDIAARGIDVKGIELVVNYDLPSNPDDYVHRIGRTARAGAAGHAISFAMPEERYEVRDIERVIRGTLPTSKLPELPPARIAPRTESHEEERGPSRGPARGPSRGGGIRAGASGAPRSHFGGSNFPRGPRRDSRGSHGPSRGPARSGPRAPRNPR